MYRYPDLARRPTDSNDLKSAAELLRGFVLEDGSVEQRMVPGSNRPPTSLQQAAQLAASRSPYENVPEHWKAQMKWDLATTSDSIFVLSPDGKTYQEPLAVRGWLSLDKLLLAEQGAHQKKMKYRAQAEALKIPKTDRNNNIRRKEKVASDDCSKYGKIREIFGNGNGNYHPNQLVAKRYLPAQGLCEKELLYKLALKISNLQKLYQKKKLVMNPYDFYRWAICRNMKSDPHNALHNSRNSITGTIRTMGDDGAHADQVFRTIVLYWASITGNENKFGKSKNHSQQRRPRMMTESSRDSAGRGGRDVAYRISRLETKRTRRRDLSARPQLFGGVNAHRAAMASRDDNDQVMG
ncbi:subunit IV of cytochrome c oxidase [Cordyceps fumosorosea ARSEF 2679]|uniref:Subunit IV of cytochrome c oxidase n=1 Tax=Cordyceps fumosorosea (strain ARSEF 2679) TaxID=1081104 RepID=A0A167LIT9_CORFA|nr:subunit IV of cytochrome c oxidase [Cordyceps fumosorosea ARSEF 2679]OAA53136.1 subunit IV of cytochrome c oxidase [Cordyceps fumosorosea ARSEF 2679]